MAKAGQPDKLLCPCCGMPRPVADTPLLRAEAEWRATGAIDTRRAPGWSVEAAQARDLQWACDRCIHAGRALLGHPAVQTWCDFNPYFAFIDVKVPCEDCGEAFIFSGAEQQHWYETLKFWVQSRPKQCLVCRRARRARRREAREARARREGTDA